MHKKSLCIAILAWFLCGQQTLQAQRLVKKDIHQSGCQAYFFCENISFEKSYSPDSSAVYTGSCRVADTVEYGIIVIALKEKVTDSLTADNLLVSYMDYLKTSFEISSSLGYGKGHTMKSYPKASGVIDFWKGKDGNEWKVKGWTDGRIISFLYVSSLKGSLSYSSKTDLYLDGFRFPQQ